MRNQSIDRIWYFSPSSRFHYWLHQDGRRRCFSLTCPSASLVHPSLLSIGCSLLSAARFPLPLHSVTFCISLVPKNIHRWNFLSNDHQLTSSNACSRRRRWLRSLRDRSWRRPLMLALCAREKNGFAMRGLVMSSWSLVTAWIEGNELDCIGRREAQLTTSLLTRSFSSFLRSSGNCRSCSCSSKVKGDLMSRDRLSIEDEPTVESMPQFSRHRLSILDGLIQIVLAFFIAISELRSRRSRRSHRSSLRRVLRSLTELISESSKLMRVWKFVCKASTSIVMICFSFSSSAYFSWRMFMLLLSFFDFSLVTSNWCVSVCLK